MRALACTLLSLALHGSLVALGSAAGAQRAPPSDALPRSADAVPWFDVSLAAVAPPAAARTAAQALDPRPETAPEPPPDLEPPAGPRSASGPAASAAPKAKKRPPRRKRPPKRRRRRAPSPGKATAPADSGGLAASTNASLRGDAVEGSHRAAILQGFVLAASIANERDPDWHTLPVGNAGSARIRLTWDEAGHVVASEVLGGAPAHLRRFEARTRTVLHQSRYTRRSEGPPGQLTLVLQASIGTEAPERSESADPHAAVAHARRFPDARGAGEVYFRFPSGRAVRVTIRAEPP